MFRTSHWEQLVGQGYTIVFGAIDGARLRAAQAAAAHLNAVHPDGDWERTRNELWREVRHCREPALMAIARAVLDPLALEILETAPPLDFVQLASTLPGFATKGGIGRHFHIDGGKAAALDAFNVLFGVALTEVASETAGGFHVLPGSHKALAAAFAQQPAEGPQPVDWGKVKLEAERSLLAHGRLVVPGLKAGDVLVAHGFLAHGTSANTSDVRRDMLFQRRAAAPLWDSRTQAAAREAFMRAPWQGFTRSLP
jgi:ectoine hydroxylase-related dioxygenase (phytanoyl-CoA dioxygenase family)